MTVTLVYKLLLAAVLSYVLLKYVLPPVLSFSFDMVLVLAEVIEFCEEKKDDWRQLLVVRLFYVFVWLFAWGIMLGLFITTQLLFMLECFGGFVNGRLWDCNEE